jgi:hypothetical protein
MIQGRRVGEWHGKHRSASGGRDKGCEPWADRWRPPAASISHAFGGWTEGRGFCRRRHPNGISDARRLSEKGRRSGGTPCPSTDHGRSRWASTRPFRDRLTGRTPRSERGDRGSTPCPGSVGRIAESSAKQPCRGGSCGKRRRWFEGSTPSRSTSRRIAQSGERLSHTQEAAGSSPASPTRRIGQVAERLSDPEEAAGSTPAPPISRDRSSAR